MTTKRANSPFDLCNFVFANGSGCCMPAGGMPPALLRGRFVAHAKLVAGVEILPWSLSSQPDAPDGGAKNKVGLLRSG